MLKIKKKLNLLKIIIFVLQDNLFIMKEKILNDDVYQTINGL